MRITAFNGSPHADKGNTHVIVDAFLAGASEAGADVENVLLAHRRILPCRGCYACWAKTPGQCVQDDDMTELLEKVSASDLVVFATPLYVDNVSGLMKNFIDRLIALGDPHMETDENGECRHVKSGREPDRIAVIANCGYPEQSHFQVLRLLFRRMARNLRCELAAEIYRAAGALLSVRVPALEPYVDAYRTLVGEAGAEVVRDGRLSESTATRLEAPLVPSPDFVADYIRQANQMWDAQLTKLRDEDGPKP